MAILNEHHPNTTLRTVFKDRVEILCDIIKAIDPKKLSNPDTRSRTVRAQRAVNEVKTLAFRTSLVPLLAKWKEEPAKFFEPWSLQPNNAEFKSNGIEPGGVEPDPSGVESDPSSTESDPSGVESELDDIESETESTESEPEIAASGRRDIESESENVEAGTKRSDLKAEFYRKIYDTRKVIYRKEADAIRWIFFTLFFRDLLIQFTNREKNDTGLLPRGKALGPLVEKVCIQVTGELALPTTANDIATWAKFGQLCHLIGAELGESAWFLLADYISGDKWIEKVPKTASSLASILEPIKKLIPEEVNKHDANKVAKGIRDFQLEPYRFCSELPGPTKRYLSINNSGLACSKRRRMPKRTINQTFPEPRSQPPAKPEAHSVNQTAQEQAGRTNHPDSIETNSHSISSNVHRWTPLENFDFANFRSDFADFGSDFATFTPELANFDPDLDNFDLLNPGVEASQLG